MKSIFNFDDFMWLLKNKDMILRKSLLEDEINSLQKMMTNLREDV